MVTYRMLDASDFDVKVRPRTAAEQEQYRRDNAPDYFTCLICQQDRVVQTPRWRHDALSEPMPGNICRSCMEHHGRAFGRQVLPNQHQLADYRLMRSLAAITSQLQWETRNARS